MRKAAARHEEALNRMLELVVLLSDDMTTSLARDGLTVARARLVWELRRHGPVTQKALADALGVSARNVTGLVDGLAATGFVVRAPHPTDRRATLVSLTRPGTATAEELERRQQEFAHYLFSGMPDEQVDGLVATLTEVLGRLSDAGLSLR